MDNYRENTSRILLNDFVHVWSRTVNLTEISFHQNQRLMEMRSNKLFRFESCSQIRRLLFVFLLSNRLQGDTWHLRRHFTANRSTYVFRERNYLTIRISSVESLITSNEHTLQSTRNGVYKQLVVDRRFTINLLRIIPEKHTKLSPFLSNICYKGQQIRKPTRNP